MMNRNIVTNLAGIWAIFIQILVIDSSPRFRAFPDQVTASNAAFKTMDTMYATISFLWLFLYR